MAMIEKYKYWDRITEYYYDNIWNPDDKSAKEFSSINTWLSTAFNCRENKANMSMLEFPDDLSLSWFMLRWQ